MGVYLSKGLAPTIPCVRKPPSYLVSSSFRIDSAHQSGLMKKQGLEKSNSQGMSSLRWETYISLPHQVRVPGGVCVCCSYGEFMSVEQVAALRVSWLMVLAWVAAPPLHLAPFSSWKWGLSGTWIYPKPCAGHQHCTLPWLTSISCLRSSRKDWSLRDAPPWHRVPVWHRAGMLLRSLLVTNSIHPPCPECPWLAWWCHVKTQLWVFSAPP